MNSVIIPAIEASDIPYGKFKILFVNVFTILYKAATLSPRKLGLDLRTINKALENSCCNTLLLHLHIIFVSVIILAKFVFGYVGLAANIIALFPILAEDFGDLLVPSIYAQFVENIIFTTLEVIIGGITVRYCLPCKIPLFSIFVAKNIIQITVGIAALNMYTDLHQSLMYHIEETDSDIAADEKELFLKKESFI
ncbi:uncharacterized protein LOC105232660 [Bactrocera dorsalis]|uniref:Uncharacterized protein LOC105232660 n=2 Tax=Bactrocera dorsalis TaxID=27457 RepID=A0A6I9VPP9_BACDO|nr:uncharacterized protein LOC105232660 [Bactrocera dorsalis]